MNHRFSQKLFFDPPDPTVLIYYFESGQFSQNAQHLGEGINWI